MPDTILTAEQVERLRVELLTYLGTDSMMARDAVDRLAASHAALEAGSNMDQGDGTFAPMPPVITDMLQLLTLGISVREPRRDAGEEEMRRRTPPVMSTEDVESLWPRLFELGGEVEIRKSRFRIEYIGTDVLVLKLLPAREPSNV